MIDAPDLSAQLARIEAQNLEILSLLGAARKPKRFLPAEEAAERLGRSCWTVRQLCNAGQIRAVKGDDGCWRIPADEVDRLEVEGVPRLPRR
jgi:excisionase family DNA binding protein